MFGFNTVDSLVSGISKKVTQLRNLADNKREKAADLYDKALVIEAEADQAQVEAERADRIANRINTLIA